MKSEATIINLLSGFWLKKKNLHVCYFLLTISFILLANGCRTNKPDAQFTASTEVATVGETIYFTNSSSHASYYQWAFGDGDAAVTKDASHAYEKSGIYTVTLVAIGHENANSASKEITVTGDITIFAGKGISEASLGDTWDTVFHPKIPFALLIILTDITCTIFIITKRGLSSCLPMMTRM